MMDVEVPNGYYMKSCDDSQIGSIPSLLSNETNNVNTQLTYLISLVQEDGTSQIVQITDKEAHNLGIFPNNTVENNYLTLNESINKDLQPLKAKRKNFLLKQQKCINKTIKRKKVVLKKTIYEKNDLLAQKNILHYTHYSKPNLIQLSEEEAKNLGVISNSSTENNKLLRIDATNSDNNTLSRPTILQANGSSTIQFTKENGNSLGNFCNTAVNLPRNGTPQNSDSVINYGSVQTKSRKVVNMQQDILLNGNIKLCSPKITLVHYPSALVPEDNNEIVKLVKEKTTNLEFYVASNETILSDGINGAKPLGSCENPIEIIKDGEMLHSTQNLSQDYLQQIAKALQCENVIERNEGDEVTENKSNIIYRVVYPEELDLNPKPSLPLKPIKRGRPKKKPPSDAEPEEEVKPMKNVRTRSGRITRPPKHIKQVFKKIDVSEMGNVVGDIKTIEFEPLKTNEAAVIKQTPEKLNLLENHQRKRSIAAQFRCLKCQKAYLGHSKMLQHLQKHPDHGPIPEYCKPRSNNDTWNFLIDLCNKNPMGQRGSKFCNELVNFWNNVQILAKVFFKKPVGTEKNMYYVDDVLSKVLDIDSGNYILNESELHKEIDVLSFIKDKNNSNAEDFRNDQNGKNEKAFNDNFDLEEFVSKCQTNTEGINGDINFVDDKENEILEKDRNDFTNSINNITYVEDKINYDTVSNSNSDKFNLKCDIMPIENYNSHIDKFNDQTINSFDENKAIENCNEISTTQDAEQLTTEQSSHSEMSLPTDLLSESSLLSSLPNLRKSVEELILNNVDNSHVTNLLDNSASSDEVMNVDQFVNERFKNLTETDLELPNTALNLDLPTLDLFQFHTS